VGRIHVNFFFDQILSDIFHQKSTLHKDGTQKCATVTVEQIFEVYIILETVFWLKHISMKHISLLSSARVTTENIEEKQFVIQ